MLAIGGDTDDSVKSALSQIFINPSRISIAVSYIQISGWKVLEEILGNFDPRNLRIVCTDQLGITDPRAIELALKKGVDIRNFSGTKTFHPKLYLSEGKETRFLLGSSNLSYPALCRSFEVNIVGEDDGTLLTWFNNLFEDKSIKFTDAMLREMSRRFTERIKSQVWIQKELPKAASKKDGSSSEILDPLLVTIDKTVVPLNMDQAGNNVRTLDHALKVLKMTETKWHEKQKSEMNLLGFTTNGKLNDLGLAAKSANNIEQLAKIWVRWIKNTDDADLAKIGKERRLLMAKSALRGFWALKDDVKKFFLDYSYNATKEQKKILRTIELMSNSSDLAKSLSLSDIIPLSRIVDDHDFLEPELKSRIDLYWNNKGCRGWKTNDRKIILEAWAN